MIFIVVERWLYPSHQYFITFFISVSLGNKYVPIYIWLGVHVSVCMAVHAGLLACACVVLTERFMGVSMFMNIWKMLRDIKCVSIITGNDELFTYFIYFIE